MAIHSYKMSNNNSNASCNGENYRNKTESETQEDSQKYKLRGYLIRHSTSDNVFVRGFIPHGTSGKKRWFIYSDSTCKLYYYKSEKDPEPLGDIDIAVASLSYSVDNGNNGLFNIR